MPRKIFEQCSHLDISSIEHLALVTNKPDQLDTSTLTKTQRAAIRFLIITQDKNIPLGLVKDAVKEVLFWTSDGKIINGVEIKWFVRKENIDKIRRFQALWKEAYTKTGK